MIKLAKPYAVFLTFISAVALSGCATDALKLAPEAADKPWKEAGKPGTPSPAPVKQKISVSQPIQNLL